MKRTMKQTSYGAGSWAWSKPTKEWDYYCGCVPQEK
jgi:hypothetical protein